MAKGFIRIDRAILERSDLTPAAKLVYGAIVDRIGKNECSWAGLRRLASDVGYKAIENVRRAVNELAGHGLIEIQKRGNGQATCYRLPDKAPTPVDGKRLHRQTPEPSTPVDTPSTPVDGPSTPVDKTIPNTRPNSRTTKKRAAQKKTLPPIPEALDTPAFREAWKDWQQHRRENGKKVTALSVTKQFNTLEGMGADRAVQAIERSIENGWQSIHEGSNGRQRNDNRKGRGEYPEPQRDLPILNAQPANTGT